MVRKNFPCEKLLDEVIQDILVVVGETRDEVVEHSWNAEEALDSLLEFLGSYKVLREQTLDLENKRN